MARIRKLSMRTVMVIMTVVLGLVTLIIQKYVYNYLSQQRYEKKQALREKVQSMRDGTLMNQHEVHANTDNNQTTSGFSSSKVILMHAFPPWYELKSGSHAFSSCNRSCILTLDPDLIEEVDSVIVYSHKFQPKGTVVRSPGQIWMYFAVESPIHSSNEIFANPEWHNLFNWTMTYRRDSDIYFGYGDIHKPSSPLPVRDFSLVVQGKSKLVAWFVSNCKTQSKREDFVEALQQFIQVDVYGNCGPLKCPREKEYCYKMLTKDYYFYLSFENSMCKDYVTEKLYHIMKTRDIVPVVRGGANYSALLPKNSYIDVSDFPDVKALAEYLKKVASDKKLYQSFLSWKNDWQAIEPSPFEFCELCYRLHHSDRWAHVYPNVDSWWRKDICHDPSPVKRSLS